MIGVVMATHAIDTRSVTLAALLMIACGPQGAATTDGASGVASDDSSGDHGTTSAPASSSGEVTSASTDATSGVGTDTTTATGQGATSDPCEFICDDTTTTPGGCDLLTQDCLEGQKCESVDMDGDGAWDSNACVPVTGDGVGGEPCVSDGPQSGVDTCAKGYMCWYLDEQNHGTCVAHCAGTWEQPVCEGCHACVIVAGGLIALCFERCDPLAQNCEDDEVCIGDPNGEGFVCTLDASGGMAPAGTPCEFANACDAGLMCADPELVPHPACADALGCCTPFCDYEQQPNPDCQALAGEVPGVECVPYHDEPLECFGPVGVCVLP